jgi:uncharacterized protein (DUF934 family)
MSIQYYNLPIHQRGVIISIQASLGALKYKVDELETIINQISPGSGSGSGSSSGNTISIPSTQITWSNPNTGDTLSIQQVLDVIKTQISLLQNTTFDATDINCKDSNSQTSNLQTELNSLYQSTISFPIPATKLTWSNPNTSDTLTVQQVLDVIKTQITFLQNTTFDAADISCKNSSNQTSDLQTQLNILYQLPTTPSLSQEEKKFYISQCRVDSERIMYDIAYGNNMLIAVGVSGTALTSESGNGYEWRYRTTGISYNLVRVIYGNDMFVVVGINGMVITSRRGYSWTDKKINSSHQYTDIVYGNGMYVAVGNYIIVTSADGTTWSGQSNPNNLASIVYGNGLFVSVGSAGKITTSSNGTTWATQTTNTTADFYKIIYGKGMFVAVGDGGIYSSPNESNWTLQSSELAEAVIKITYGNNLFVAVGNSSKKVVTSTDGITWEVKSSGVANWYGIAYGNNLYVAVGSSPAVIATSPDGITWTKQTNPDGIPVYLLGVHYENNKFIIRGDGKFYTCHFCTEVEIQIIELDKRFSRVQPNWLDD